MEKKRVIRDDGRYVLLYSSSDMHAPPLPQVTAPSAPKPPTCPKTANRSSGGEEKNV